MRPIDADNLELHKYNSFGGEFGKSVFLTREEAEAALKGEV